MNLAYYYYYYYRFTAPSTFWDYPGESVPKRYNQEGNNDLDLL